MGVLLYKQCIMKYNLRGPLWGNSNDIFWPYFLLISDFLHPIITLRDFRGLNLSTFLSKVYSIWTRAFSQLGYEHTNFTRKDTVKTCSNYLRLSLFQPLVLLLLCHKSKSCSFLIKYILCFCFLFDKVV